MTTPPYRALLSLKSMLVMCASLGIFCAANMVAFEWQSDDGEHFIITRGIPKSYYREHWVKARPQTHVQHPDESIFRLVRYDRFFWLGELCVDMALALASERFVFSQMRRRSS
jgi:hypothetical protein